MVYVLISCFVSFLITPSENDKLGHFVGSHLNAISLSAVLEVNSGSVVLK